MTKKESVDYSVPPTSEQAERTGKWLALSGYRLVRPLVKRAVYCADTPPDQIIKVAILDTETTGFDTEKDRMIELGLTVVEVCPETGIAYRIIASFGGLEDPGFRIPSASIAVHGITNKMVKGKRIDEEQIATIVAGVDLVVAHNAGFDRPFVERRFSCFATLPWACSYQQIPWREEGIGSASQEYLAYRFGFHYAGHRALNDCEALLEVLQQRLPGSGQRVMQALLTSCRTEQLRILALDAPFAAKDALKARGYRWDAARKLWGTTLAQGALPEEASWLRATVYGGKAFRLEQEVTNAINRFSARPGVVEVISYQ